MTGCAVRQPVRILLFLIAALVAVPAPAAEVIRFCFVAWSPYTRVDSGQAQGISVEVLREAARRAGLAASFDEMPWRRCLTEVEIGNYDAAMDGARRLEFIAGRHSYVTSHYGFFVRQDDARRGGSDPAGFAGRRISLVQGWWYPEALTGRPDLDFERLDSEAGQLRSLAAGRQDAAYGDLLTLGAAARALGLADAVRPLLPAHVSVSFYPLFNGARADLAGRIDGAIGAMFADGTIDGVYRARLGRSFRDLARMAAGQAPAGN